MLLNMSLISSNALSCPFSESLHIKLRWDITMADSNEMSLLEATYDSEAAKVCLLLHDSDVHIDARDEGGHTFLLLVAARGYGGIVAPLLLEGAAVEAADKHGGSFGGLSRRER